MTSLTYLSQRDTLEQLCFSFTLESRNQFFFYSKSAKRLGRRLTIMEEVYRVRT